MTFTHLQQFDLIAFARSAQRTTAHQSGQLLLSDLPRIAAEQAISPPTPSPVIWSIHGHSEQSLGSAKPLLSITMELRTNIWLMCQRCLQPYLQPIVIHNRFAIVQTEEQAQALDMENDEVDAIVGSHQFDLLELIEEELLLALPLVHRHESCTPPALAPSPDKTVQIQATQASPFSILAELKQKK